MSLSIQLCDVSKVYPPISGASRNDGDHHGTTVVDQVSLNISEGDRLGIIGRNGAGKSTLLQMIADVSEPSAGTIKRNGKITSILSLGFGLREHLTGRENIYLDGSINGATRESVESSLDSVIEFSELGEFIDHPVRTYSSGMRARLAFSIISEVDPEILIIDEALAVGDASFSLKATKRIHEICARGKIVIVVSHAMQSIRDICNRCVYLKDGRVVMDGAPEIVTDLYTEEVRREDEASLLDKFHRHVGTISKMSGYHIDHLKLFSANADQSSLIIEAERPLRIEVAGICEQVEVETLCRVRIVRLDDTLFFQEDFSVGEHSKKNKQFLFSIYFDQLPLGAAIYRLDAELRSTLSVDAVSYASCSIVFEVFRREPEVGGKAMLAWPLRASVRKIKCSEI